MAKFRPTVATNISQLRNIVFGNDTYLPRNDAVRLLLSSDYPDKTLDCKSFLENPNESPIIRYSAAIALADINTPTAREILVKNTDIEDKQVLEGIIMALGRIGDEHSLTTILGLAKKNTGHIAKRAEFTASLISYRHGLKGNELPDATECDYLSIQSDVQSIRIVQTEEEVLRKCILSIKNKTFGIGLLERPSYQLKLGKNVNIILLNSDIVINGGIKLLLEKKAVLGIVAQKNEETGEYFVGYLILTSPVAEKNRINILLARSHGKISFGGIATVNDNSDVVFKIQSISEVGLYPLRIEGIIHDNKLQIKNAEFSPRRIKRHRPVKTSL